MVDREGTEMCGIAGKISRNPFPTHIVEEMGCFLSHRGPDDSGLYSENLGSPDIHYGNNLRIEANHFTHAAFYHKRLSIIDQSSRARQPMPNEDKTIWLVFNGEIYNAGALRGDLINAGHRFRSKSDSEVLVHAYEQWGVDCLSRLNGMFAFALWNENERSLFCGRDPMGIKPFYYRHDSDSFSFASEIKSFYADTGFSPSLDRKALSWYLSFSFPVGANTWFQGINRLLPGQAILYRDGSLRLWRFFDYAIEASNGSPRKAEAFYEILSKAVECHLISDVPIGFHLSGGLDSSGIAAIARKEFSHNLTTFSGRFEEGKDYDERPFIEAFRRQYQTDHKETVPDVQGFMECMTKIIWHLDEPTAGPGSYPQFRVSRMVKENGIKAVCVGHGGDELFGGYPWYLNRRDQKAEMIRQNRLNALSEIFREFTPDCTRKAFLSGFEDRLTGLLTWDVKYYLPALLHVEDRMSMAFSVESRVPYLDRDVVKTASLMSAQERIKSGILKAPLREALASILPSKIARRKDKMGFPTPFGPWLRGPLKNWAEEILLSRQTEERGLINVDAASRFLDCHIKGEDWSIPLWQAVNVELWCRTFIDGEHN
ncbi:asparagine synthase (glutamine-hydrolyzing) [Thermodesulfobacteriota bacterium]